MTDETADTADHELILGIDLGTTNSEVAVVEEGVPRILNGDDDDPILPSIVGLSNSGQLLVGRPARNQLVVAPERTIKSIKRKMGQDVTVALGDQTYRPQEISAMILRTLKDRAAAALGREVKKAVITVPAYFNDTQRQATIEAGELAGLEVVRILNEPTAAALTYDPQQHGMSRVLVYDLGGGTFDVSIVQNEGGVVEVLASHGDTQLGGDDFDHLLVDWIAQKFRDEHGIDLREDPVRRARLTFAAEAAKKRLSDDAYTRVEEEFIAEKEGAALHLDTEVTRMEFEQMIEPLMTRTMDCVQRSLDDAGLTASQIDRVVLVGGSTRVPLVAQLLEDRMGKIPSREVHPELCVALGAAVQGAIIAGQQVGTILVDITPHSLGIKAVDTSMFDLDGPAFIFVPILPRGTPLPAIRSELFRTVSDRQKDVEIEVYQGEDEDVDENHRLGMFRVTGLAPVPAGNLILVQLEMNLNGVLHATAREKSTGLQKQITIENALAQFQTLERENAASRLEQFWQNAAEANEEGEVRGAALGMGRSPVVESAPGEGQREQVQGRALLEKAERVRERASPEDRVELDLMSQRLNAALAERRWAETRNIMGELSDMLFHLEG